MRVNVLLVNTDPAGNNLTGDRDAGRIVEALNGLFHYTLARGGSLNLSVSGLQVVASWAACSSPISATPTDVVVYFVTNTSRSVVSSIGGLSPSANEMGFTNFQRVPLGQTGAEIYTQPNIAVADSTHANSTIRVNADQMTAVAYHEVMHYKLHYDDNQLHTLTGGRLAQAHPSNQPLKPSDADIRALVPALTNAWTPLLNGCAIYQGHLAAERAARNSL